MSLNDFPTLRPGQPVLVYWWDATTDTGWEDDAKHIEKDCLMQTIGFYKDTTANGILLCGTCGTYSKGDNDRFFIPLGTIVDIHTYPIPRKPKLEK